MPSTSRRHALLGGILAAGALCACASGSLTSLPGLVRPTVPTNEEEKIISQSLGWVIVDDKDFPAYERIAGADTLIVLNEFRVGKDKRILTSGGLPHIDRVRFMLLARKEIDAAARISGRVEFLSVDHLEISPDIATIEVTLRSLQWTAPDDHLPWIGFAHGSHTGSCTVRYRREDGEWRFAGVGPCWS